MAELSQNISREMDRVVAGLTTKSDKIRKLGERGFPRGDIARYLGIRYQHVRNVLLAAEKKSASSDEDSGRPARQEWVQVGPDGRVAVPTAYRQALGIEPGGQVLMLLEDGEIRLVGRSAAIRRAQELVARYIPKGAKLVDELLAERRREAAREERGE